jgi:hypothetical protein
MLGVNLIELGSAGCRPSDETGTDYNNIDTARYKIIVDRRLSARRPARSAQKQCFQIDTSSELYYYWLGLNEFTLSSLQAAKRFI